MDVAGENHIDIDHGMWKQRLGPDGSAIGEAFTEVVSVEVYTISVSFAEIDTYTRTFGHVGFAFKIETALHGGSAHHPPQQQ